MTSSIYEGWIRHRRFSPVPHSFRYGLYMVAIDLVEVADGNSRILRFLGNRFKREDHFGDPTEPLLDEVKRELKARLGLNEVARVVLLTNLRSAGYVMNPVSFYYCLGKSDEPLAVLAEVHNTPWGETHLYAAPYEGVRAQSEFDKEFHVSPFMPMDHEYRWRFSEPGAKLSVHMENWSHDHKVFDATLVLRQLPATGRSALMAQLRHPGMSLQVLARIYWQAARLWMKRAPIYDHPRKAARGNR